MAASDDVIALHARSVQLFLDRIATVPPDRWSDPTPCSDWNVRELVNHIVYEDRWTVPLVEGRTIAEVGDSLEGDLLGAAPVEAADAAAKAAVDAFAAPGARERVVHLSFGDTPAEEYAWQLLADHVVHGWDLAVATGGDTTLDPELVTACATWFANVEEMYRGAGAIGPAVDAGAAGSEQDRLLGAFGRDARWTADPQD